MNINITGPHKLHSYYRWSASSGNKQNSKNSDYLRMLQSQCLQLVYKWLIYNWTGEVIFTLKKRSCMCHTFNSIQAVAFPVKHRTQNQHMKLPLTFDLSDTAEGVFEGVKSAGAPLHLSLWWQTDLQLIQGSHQLFLGLDASRLIAAAAAGGRRVLFRAGAQQAVSQRAAGWRGAVRVWAEGEGIKNKRVGI